MIHTTVVQVPGRGLLTVFFGEKNFDELKGYVKKEFPKCERFMFKYVHHSGSKDRYTVNLVSGVVEEIF
jgi:hypothetical protein